MSTRLRTPRGFDRTLSSTGVALALGVVVASPALAQAHTSAVAPDSIRRIQHLEPRSGPPGTVVSVHTKNLPLQAKVVLGVGAIGTGFEELGVAEQQEMGEVTASVRVPESASWDRALVFIIFNGNFSPTGLSDPFHVTNADGLVYRVGAVTDEGDGCLAMRDRDGYLYTLSGDIEGLTPGDELAVEARFFALSDCPQGETLHVERRLPVPEPEDPGDPGAAANR
ncbi:MAG: hypothetical protein R3195_02140 [Gemmatimonadota bacterium]|nr:hypothetical protein [Gemmatimonadota bacterium]